MPESEDILHLAAEGVSAYSPCITVKACGRSFILHRASSLEELWEDMTTKPEQVDDERLPYWTELWPSSVALAEWLYQCKEEIAGKKCLDLGCGLGLTAMVGQWLGASVLGMDYEEEALRFARKNATVNAVPSPLWTVMDWRRPAVAPGSIARLWGGDIMYERRFVHPVLNFLEYVLEEKGKAWIAEPCRSVYDAFRGELCKRKWHGKRVFAAQVDPIYAQPVRVTVHVWELTR